MFPLPRKFCLVLFVSATTLAVFGQTAVGAPTLYQLTRKAGYVFSGTVLSVKPIEGRQGKVPNCVEVTFRVDKGIRGTKSGQTLTIREWGGLWNSRERYRPGERVFLFLYAPSRLGLTSPVGGDWGKLAVDNASRVVLPAGLMSEIENMRAPNRTPSAVLAIPMSRLVEAARRASEE